MNLLIEIQALKGEDEIFFNDIYLDDLPSSKGGIILNMIQKCKSVDRLVVYLSDEASKTGELIDLWELPVTGDSCADKLLEIFNKIERSKNEDQGTDAHGSYPHGAIRQSPA